MAEFRVLDESIFHVSVASADLDVVDGLVDLSDVEPELRPVVERELDFVALLERDGEFTEEVAAEDSDQSDNEAADAVLVPDLKFEALDGEDH